MLAHWHTFTQSLGRVRLKGVSMYFFYWHTWHTFKNIILCKMASSLRTAGLCYGKKPRRILRGCVWPIGTLGTLFYTWILWNKFYNCKLQNYDKIKKELEITSSLTKIIYLKHQKKACFYQTKPCQALFLIYLITEIIITYNT